MNTFTMNRLANTFDNLIAFFSKHVFWIHILIIWAISVIFTTESHERSWEIFVPVLGVLMAVFTPVLFFSFF
ncbi:MAG: hypothetical protein AB8G11_13505 [Saprospiraceae bacterium]